MDFQENFFKDQILKIHKATGAKENQFEKLQHEERKKIEDFETAASHTEDLWHRSEEAAKLKELQNQEIKKYVAKREHLTQMFSEKKIEMKKRRWKEEVELEQEFETNLTKLINKYAPQPTGAGAGAGADAGAAAIAHAEP